MLETLIFLLNEIIQHTWIVASAVLKYYLGAVIIYKAVRKDLSVESLEKNIFENARIVSYLLIISGTVVFVAEIELDYMFRAFSQVVALLYFGFLFYRY